MKNKLGSIKTYSTLAAITTLTTGLVFIGHGTLAAQKSIEWVSLFAGVLEIFIKIDIATVAELTRAVGIIDIFFGSVLLLLGAGLCLTDGTLRRFATSKVSLVLLGIAAFWQFMTSLAYIFASGEISPGIWLFLERSPSFIVPIIGLLAIIQVRRK